jgi:hypothetical protein
MLSVPLKAHFARQGDVHGVDDVCDQVEQLSIDTPVRPHTEFRSTVGEALLRVLREVGFGHREDVYTNSLRIELSAVFVDGFVTSSFKLPVMYQGE